MTNSLDEIKQIFYKNAIKHGACKGVYDAMNSTSFQEIMNVGKEFAKHVIRTGIITRELLEEIPVKELLEAGIYINDIELVNPKKTVYVFYDTKVKIIVDDSNMIEVINFGSIQIEMKKDSYCNIQSYLNSETAIEQNDNSISEIKLANFSKISMLMKNDSLSTSEISTISKSKIELQDNSFLKLKIDDCSDVTISKSESARLDINKYDKAKYNIVTNNENSKANHI